VVHGPVNASRLQQHLREIRQAGPLVIPVALEIGAVLQQDPLHPVGIADEFGAHREERGQQSGDVRCRHAGAGEGHIELIEALGLVAAGGAFGVAAPAA